MKKRRFTIGNKILAGFLGLIIIFIIYVVYSVVINNHNNKQIIESSNVISPSANYLKDFKTMAIRSRMLITNWVYLPKNDSDKQALQNLHKIEYPELKGKIVELAENWDDSLTVKAVDSVFIQFENLLDIQQTEIMANLQSFDDYEDPMIKFMAEETIESVILNESEKIIADLDEIINDKDAEATEAQMAVINSSKSLKNTTILLGVILSALGLIVAYFMSRSITRPINFLRSIINKLAKGELAESNQQRFAGDEIGEMAEAVERLVAGLRSTSLFAENIGNGKYDSDFTPLSEHDVLGNALIEMRNNLKKVAEEDKRRNWATEGLAKFGEILRKNNDNIENLSDQIIANLIKYLSANQGGLYIINDDDANEPYLYLAACYAWDKKKYVEQKIYKGDGLTGQSWIEKDTIYLTDVPKDYITITSGLGEATPTSILIVPLKVNDEIYGVIEIASFNLFDKYEIEFVEKIAESIASTISSVKINQTTQKLLEESTEMTEQMRAQEEEMRQNMEELQATQEEMQRAGKEREARERIIDSTNMMLELDEDFKVLNINSKVTQLLRYDSSDLKGRPFQSLAESNESFEPLKNSLENQQTWSGVIKLISKQKESIAFKISAGKIVDMSGASKYLLIAADVSVANA